MQLHTMKKHTKVYLQYFGYTGHEYMPCEVCSASAVDIHHIEARGMGGSNQKDVIENLMGLCRACHIKYGDIKHYKEFLIDKHTKFMQEHGK